MSFSLARFARSQTLAKWGSFSIDLVTGSEGHEYPHDHNYDNIRPPRCRNIDLIRTAWGPNLILIHSIFKIKMKLIPQHNNVSFPLVCFTSLKIERSRCSKDELNIQFSILSNVYR